MDPVDQQLGQQPLSDVPVFNPTIKNLYTILGIVLIIVLSVSIIFSYLILNRMFVLPFQVVTHTEFTNPNPSQENTLALISYVPHFNHLTLGDLPLFSETGKVFNYNGHKIIISGNSFIEYDQTKKQFIRQNNPDVLPCIFSSAIIGDNLYIGCNGKSVNDPSTLYKISLKSGKILKKYDTLSKFGDKLVNIHLLSVGNTLWISSWGGVIKMDSVSEQTKLYAPLQVLPHGCLLDSIWLEKNQLMVSSDESPCRTGVQYEVGTYNSQTDTWQPTSITVDKYISMINNNQLSAVKFSLEVPQFYAISQLVNKKYYLFSEHGVYSLREGQFPQLLFSVSKSPKYASFANAYVTSNETYAVVIGGFIGLPPPNPTIANQMFAILINLRTKEVTDLIDQDRAFTLPVNPKTQLEISDLINMTLQETPDGILIKNKDNQPFALINVQTKTLTFQ